MNAFDDAFSVVRFDDASFFAAQLFEESFRVPFPVPRDDCGLPIPTPKSAWHQFVAFYAWPEGLFEPVGFCNWIRYGDVYLEGGMCVRRTFYRRLPRPHWQACKARGGVAQIMMETAASRLGDCDAWFGYCGDKKAYLVDARVGFEPTDRKYLIVKWFRTVDAARRAELIRRVDQVGPF